MSTLNVFRYSALAAGVIYGAYHTSQLKSAASKAEEAKIYAKKEALIAEAKVKFAELNKKPEPVAAPKVDASAEINLDDDKLDFAELILSAVNKLEA